MARSKLNLDRLKYIEAYEEASKENESLARYLAVNRFGLLMKSKLAGDEVWKEALAQLNLEYLNKKQRWLLQLNGYQLKGIKKVQDFLIKKGLYLSPFRP